MSPGKGAICEWLEELRRCYDTPVISRAPHDCDPEQRTQPGYNAISSDRTLPSGDHKPGKPQPISSKETELVGKSKRLLKKADLFSAFHSSYKRRGRRQWQPTPVLLPGKSHGPRSLVGCSHGVARSRTRLSDFTFTLHFHTLEKEMATHSSVLAWRIPGMGEPGGLPSMGSQRVGHN